MLLRNVRHSFDPRRDWQLPTEVLSCADQMQFAKIVKEGYETTVFPVPLNVLEHLVNRIAGGSEQKEGKTTLNW